MTLPHNQGTEPEKNGDELGGEMGCGKGRGRYEYAFDDGIDSSEVSIIIHSLT